MLWVWYYDRQGIIQSDGINIIADFPRFLLLQVFQRFTLEDWGVIPSLNPDATRAHEDDSTLILLFWRIVICKKGKSSPFCYN